MLPHLLLMKCSCLYVLQLAGEVLAYDHVDVIRSTTKNATRNNATGVQYFSGDRHSEVYYLIDTARYASVTAVINCNPVFNKNHLSNISSKYRSNLFKISSRAICRVRLFTLKLSAILKLCGPLQKYV